MSSMLNLNFMSLAKTCNDRTGLSPPVETPRGLVRSPAVSSRTRNLDFGGFDSGRFLIQRGGIPRSTGTSLEIRTPRFLLRGLTTLNLAALGRWDAARLLEWGRGPAATTTNIYIYIYIYIYMYI